VSRATGKLDYSNNDWMLTMHTGLNDLDADNAHFGLNDKDI